ncbi:MAG: hypothetical protein CBD77_01510 [bacterium TMED217]|nr:MAG: hypothetical protein CBD77_01510 [bacterium TMED217]|tara:strand:+ start:4690 stop:5214 length:525 start_codon:yes stop_codon:yes gene_type:complete
MHDDNNLIQKFQSGDEKSFDKLVEIHLHNVFGFFLKITRDEMVAEDLSQDVFMKLYKNLKNFRHESSFSTYLYKINMNTANTWITRNKWKNILHIDQIPDRGEIDRTNEEEWKRKELWDGISKLPKKQRTVVMLRISDSLSYKEISDITGMSKGSAKVNYHHAIKRLKEILDDA